MTCEKKNAFIPLHGIPRKPIFLKQIEYYFYIVLIYNIYNFNIISYDIYFIYNNLYNFILYININYYLYT